MSRIQRLRARHGQQRGSALLAFALLVAPALLAAAPAAGAPTPQAGGQRIAYFDDFASGDLDPERWVLPSAWGLERSRMKPWEFPTLPLNDSLTPHLSDSPFSAGARYAPANRTWVETNWIDLTAATSTAQLSLFHRYDVDPAEDTAFVMARSELRGWTVISPTSGYPRANGFVGSSLVFTGTTFDLSLYAGSRVKLAFEIISGTNGATGDGWQVQSMQVAYSTPESLPDLVANELQLWVGEDRIYSGTAGQLIELRLVVGNPGTAAPPLVVPVVFYDGQPGTGRLVGRADLAAVAPGGLGRASAEVVLGPGTHTLVAIIDPAGATDELSHSNNAASTVVTLDPPSGVDLVPIEFQIEAAGIPTTGARPGAGLTANVTISNMGAAGVTTPFTIGLFLRQSPNSTVLLQDDTLTLGIAAGESRAIRLDFTAIAGDLTLIAVVDTQAEVAELSETNNEVERTFPVADDPGVDLELLSTRVLRGGAATPDAVEGELLQVAASVRNAGTSAITEPFTVSAYLGDPDAGGTQVYSRRVAGGLLANQTIEITGSWVALLGVRVLYVYLDVGREVFESNEVNNKGSDQLTVRADTTVNLAVTDVAFMVFGREVQSTQVGAPVNITVTVSNLGVETDVDGFLSLSPENPWVYPATTPLETLRLPTTIARQGQAVMTFPWTAVAGSHVFYFTADYALTVPETREFDNIAARTLEVSTDSPDLSVSPVSVKAGNLVETSALTPQLNVTIWSEVTNVGIKDVNDPFQVDVWAGQPGELGSVRLYRTIVPPPFEVGEAVEVEFDWFVTFPTSGAQRIIAIADPNGSIVESDRTNNVGDKEVTYAAGALPNLQVESVSAYRGGASVVKSPDGATVEVQVVLVNSSPVPFTAGTVLEARDGVSLIFSAPIPRLDPGQRATYAFNWTASLGAHIRVSVNLLGDVPESDYNDNALDLLLVVEKPKETPWALYGAGAGAAAVGGLAFLLLVRRRRSRGDEAPAAPSLDAPLDAAAAEAPVVAPDAAPSAPNTCPSCHEPVEPEWKMCPSCEATIG